MPQYLDLLNGQPLPYDKAGIQRIMMRAYHLIGETGQSATKLATLLRILHYNTNLEWTNKRLEISNRLATVREGELALKKSRSQNQSAIRHPNFAIEDHLGPIPTTLDDLEARATRKFNLPPPPAPEKRAAEPPLSQPSPQTLSNSSPELREAPGQKCQMQNAQCSMLNEKLTPSTLVVPAKTEEVPLTLESRVNKYTLARYHEALIGKDPTKVGRSAAFNFRTADEHCPCGNHLPCPDHGDFPPRFFEVSPDDPDFFWPLQKKNLPFTSVHELLRREAEKSEAREAPDLNAK